MVEHALNKVVEAHRSSYFGEVGNFHRHGSIVEQPCL